jgi:hypothetical protein
MAICKACGNRYSKWTTPFSSKGVCRDCFKSEPGNEPEAGTTELAPAPEDVPAARRKERIRLTSFLPRSRSKVVFILVMACYSWTIASVIGSIVRACHVAPPPIGLFANAQGEPTAHVVDLLFLAPLIESLILLALIELFRGLHLPAWLQVLLPALLIGILHSPRWWPRGFIVAPSFAIDACAYLYWRSASRKTAYGVVAAIHALHNFVPAVSVIAYAAWHG